jgi:hypothetical protein
MELITTNQGENKMTSNQDKSWAYSDVLINLDLATICYGDNVMECVTHKFEGARIQEVAVVNIREEKVNGYTTVVGDLVGEKYYRTGSNKVQEIAQAFEFTPNPNYNGPTPSGVQVARYQERYWAAV